MPEPAPVETVDLADPQAFAVTKPPQLLVEEAGITLEIAEESQHVKMFGNCIANARVVITGHRLFPPITTACRNQRYEVTTRAPLARTEDISATQLTLLGDLHVARLRSVPSFVSEVASPDRLQELSLLQHNGETRRIVIPAGTYSDVNLNIGSTHKPDDQPLIIDGNGAATFKGATFIRISRDNVTLTGFSFAGSGPSAIEVSGANVRISQSQFVGCGDQAKPQSQCIVILPGATGSEIDFNRFENSASMSIKVRAGAAGTALQPTGTFIHHNVFQDIERHSGNGQEPIQIAGPGGGASGDALDARIEHNLFVRTNGDVETISLKAPGVRVRWNSFYDSDAAPNFRGADDDEVSGNILRATRGMRIAGSHQLLAGNIIICPKGPALLLTHGSAGYANAENVTISDNLIVTAKAPLLFAAQEQPPASLAIDNVIVRNMFVTSGRGPAIKDQSIDRDPSVLNTIKENVERADANNICRPVAARPLPPAMAE